VSLWQFFRNLVPPGPGLPVPPPPKPEPDPFPHIFLVRMSDVMWASCIMLNEMLGCEMHESFARAMMLLKTVEEQCQEGDQLAIVDSEGKVITTITYK
jgi:hypothetical protein